MQRSPMTALTSLTLLFLLPPGIAQAQTLYRCGKVVQDRPCENAGSGRAIGGTGSTRDERASISPGADAVCAARAERAKKLVWAKEVGQTREQQLQAQRSAEDQQLVLDVYQARGNSNEVAASIEAKCIAEREKAAQMAAEAAALARLRMDASAPPAPASTAAAPVSKVADTRTSDKRQRCDAIATEIGDVQERQRRGGNNSTMESLRERLNTLENRRFQEGC